MLHRCIPHNDVCSVGRSMIEMLGVLAIIGVLTVGGIAGYSKAMEKYKMNKIISEYSFMISGLLEHLNNAVPFNAFPLRDCTLSLESVAAWRAGNYLPRYALAFIERMEQLENQKCNNSAIKSH